MTVINDKSMQTRQNNHVHYESFYPLGLSLNGKYVAVFGGNDAAYDALLHLMEAGANATVIAQGFVSEIQELQLTYGRRIELIRHHESDYLESALFSAPGIAFSLIFSFVESQPFSDRLLVLAEEQPVSIPVFSQNNVKAASFVPVTVLKRGHVKISVSTDGLCQPLESALTARIEELLINDFDHYSLFVAAVQERLEADSELSALLNCSEELASALSRRNFDEALRIIDQLRKPVIEEPVDGD